MLQDLAAPNSTVPVPEKEEIAPRIREWAELLVGTPTVSDKHSTADLAQDIEAELKPLGIRVQSETYQERRYGPAKAWLIAWKGPETPESGLLLSGHLDTVDPERQPWTRDPFRLTPGSRRENGMERPCWFGLGTADMKSFIAIALHLLESVSAEELAHPVGVVLTSDEEVGLRGAKRLHRLVRAGKVKLGRWVIVGEPTSLQPFRKHKGHVPLRVSVRGREAHAGDPDKGENAILNMLPVLQAIQSFADVLRHVQDEDIDPPHITVNIGQIRGGTVVNTVPGFCTISLSIRTVQGFTADWIRAELLRHIQQHVPPSVCKQTKVEFLRLPTEPFRATPGSPLIRAAEAVTGKSSTCVFYNTEAAIFQSLGCECVVLGPGSIQNAHRADEYIDLCEVERGVAVYETLIRNFCCKE